MNRRERRAIERAAKKTHKLQTQVCVVWMPDARGYFQSFGADGVTVAADAHDAQLCCEHTASRVALQLAELYGVRAQVRPYVAIDPRHFARASSAPAAHGHA